MDSDKLEAAHAIMKAIHDDIAELFERQNFGPAGLDDLVKFCEDIGLDATDILRQAIYDRLRCVVREIVVRGKWLRLGEIPAGQNNLEERLLYECSNCGTRQIVHNDRFIGMYKFCPTCGAKMGV